MQWQQHLAGLLAGHHTTGDPLDAGARLVVLDPDGTEAFRAPLARHHRIDEGDAHLIWIRPILPGTPDPATGQQAYNLSLCRRRGLQWDYMNADADSIELELASGQHARIEPADGPELSELQSWDTFTLTVLTAEEEHELDALSGDGWTGRFA